MYRVLLVDDEYMITEGLKVLIPFEKWNMEVVSTANDAETTSPISRTILWIWSLPMSICQG